MRMKKLFVVIAIGMFLITMFAIAAAEANETNVSETATASEAEATAIEGDITQRVEDVSSPKEISGEVQKYVEEFVEKKGVKAEKINKVSRVNFEDLPKEVNIENVNDANLAIYGVDYNESSNEGEQAKKVFVITYSVDKLRSQGDLIIAQDKREFLNFGSSEKMTAPGFLDTATGVETSLENGYVMMRSGSITGISTGLNVDKDGTGIIEIIIYKNGEKIMFSNSVDASSEGFKKDYDVQSKGVVEFEPGDVISAYANAGEGVSWENVITIVEITTN